MDGGIDAFFNVFLDHFNAGRMQELHSVYDEPVVWISPMGTRTYDSRGIFAAHMAELRQLYVDNGLVVTRKQVHSIESFGVGLHLAHVAWQHLRRDGDVMAEVTTTYVLRDIKGGFVVSAQISHDEIYQRPLGGPNSFVA